MSSLIGKCFPVGICIDWDAAEPHEEDGVVVNLTDAIAQKCLNQKQVSEDFAQLMDRIETIDPLVIGKARYAENDSGIWKFFCDLYYNFMCVFYDCPALLAKAGDLACQSAQIDEALKHLETAQRETSLPKLHEPDLIDEPLTPISVVVAEDVPVPSPINSPKADALPVALQAAVDAPAPSSDGESPMLSAIAKIALKVSPKLATAVALVASDAHETRKAMPAGTVAPEPTWGEIGTAVIALPKLICDLGWEIIFSSSTHS